MSEPATARDRRRAVNAVKEGLRELRTQLAALNHRVGSEASLRDADLDTFDLVARHGPVSPSALARLAGLHPATMTGILDRLEKGGWIARERDPADRRVVLGGSLRDRQADLQRLYAPMSRSMNKLVASYSDTELEVIADFLKRCGEAGRDATAELAASEPG